MKQERSLDKQKSVKFNLIMNILVTILNVIFPLISFPYVSRILSPSGMGKFTYITSVISYFQLFASLGINTYGIKVCAENRDDKKKLTAIYKELMIILVITTLVSYVGIVILYFITFRNSMYESMYWISAASIFFQLIGVEWLFKAKEQYTYIAVRSFGVKVVSLILMFIFIRQSTDYVFYAAIIVFSNGASYVLNFIKSREYVDFCTNEKLHIKRHLAPMMIFFVTNIIHLVYTNVDILMLKHSKGDYEVGIYNASLRIESLLLAIVTALGVVVLPKLSIALKNKKYEEFNKVNSEAVNFILMLGFFLVGAFEVCAKECILVLGGEQYVDSIVILRILMPIVLIAGLANITGVQVLIPINKERFFMISVAVGAIIDFVLNLIFLQDYGAMATAFSTLIAELIVLIMQLLYLRKLEIQIFSKIIDYNIVVVGIISQILGLIFGKMINTNSIILDLLIKGSIFWGIFLVLSKVLRVKTYIQFKNELKKKLHKNN